MSSKFFLTSPWIEAVLSSVLIRKNQYGMSLLLVAICFILNQPLYSQTSSVDLFSTTVAQRAAAFEQTDDSPVVVLRSRSAGVNPAASAALGVRSRPGVTRLAATSAVNINLFPDTNVPLYVESVEPTHDGFGSVIRGYTGPNGEGRVILTSYRGALAGFIRLENEEAYEVFVAPDGEGEVKQVRFDGSNTWLDDFVIPEEDENGVVRASKSTAARSFSVVENGVVTRAAGGVSTLDVLIAYTERSKNARGGDAGMLAHINTVIAQSNEALVRSSVAMQLRLVHAVQVTYDDNVGTLNYSTALSALRSSTDGKMDEVHALRNQYGADVVGLFVSPTSAGTVGMGYMMTSSPSTFGPFAFSVTNQAYAGGTSMSFVHEVGHNLGLHHDKDNGGASGGYYADSRGYQQKTLAPTFRTIMAYASGCSGCTAIGQFSNANLTYSGIPTGIVGDIDAARTLNITAPIAVDWRAAVAQQACSYTVNATSLSASAAGTSLSTSVSSSSGCSWTASSNTNWITITSGSSGSGSGSVTLTVSANTSTSSRTGTVTVAGQTVTVTQAAAACQYALGSNSLSVGSSASTSSVAVSSTSGCSWTASSNAAWITVSSGASGSANGTVGLSFGANPNAASRTGTVTIAGQTVTVTQAAVACNYTLSTANISTGNGAGSGSVGVTTVSGCNWSAASSSPWIAVSSGNSGTASGTVTLSFSANPDTVSRTGSVTIAGQTVTVTQAAAACQYGLSTASLSVQNTASNGSVSVTSTTGCNWTSVSNANWLSITSGATGSANGVITFSIAANTATSNRSGTLTIAGSTLTVNQAAAPCTYGVSATSLSTTNAGGAQSVNVTASGGCSWAASSTANWITIASGATGSGDGSVVLQIAANPTSVSRTATVSVAGKTITVSQAAAPCEYIVSATSLSFGNAGNTGSVTVGANAGCAWSAASGSTWIAVTSGSSGDGNGTVSFSVAANPGYTSRSGAIVVAGKTVAITQESSPIPCSYSLGSTTYSAAHGGGSTQVAVTATGSCSWSANTTENWISVSGGGSGNGQVTISVAENTSYSARTGSVSVAGQTFTVSQAAAPEPAPKPVVCTYQLSANSGSISSDGGSHTLTISAGETCAWTASPSAAWLSLLGSSSGTGNGSISLQVSANTSTAARSATVAVAGQNFTLTQSGVPEAPVLTLSQSAVSMSSYKGSSTVSQVGILVQAGGKTIPFTVKSSLPAWLSATPVSGVTPGSIVLTASNAALEPGTYQTTVVVDAPNSQNRSVSLSVEFRVLAQTAIVTSVRSLSFRAVQGATTTVQSVSLRSPDNAVVLAQSMAESPWLSTRVVPSRSGWMLEATANPRYLAPGVYDETVTVSCLNDACGELNLPVRILVLAPASVGPAGSSSISSGGVVNGASFAQGIAEGSWASLFGSNLTASTRMWSLNDFNGSRMPTELDGVSIKVDGKAAPLHFISPGQLNFQVPTGIRAGWVPVEVQGPFGTDLAYAYNTAEAPGLFQFNGEGQIAAVHASGQPVMPSVAGGLPAKVGQIISIFGTGFGATSPRVESGVIYSGAAPLVAKGAVEVTVGGVPAIVHFIGLSGAGLNQMNLQVPVAPAGNHEILMTINGVSVQFGGYITVQ